MGQVSRTEPKSSRELVDGVDDKREHCRENKAGVSPDQYNTPPEQLIDIDNGRAVNAENVLGFRYGIEAEITPAARNKVKVQLKKFNLGPIAFDVPNNLNAELSVTYLDEDMRIGRGDKGNTCLHPPS